MLMLINCSTKICLLPPKVEFIISVFFMSKKFSLSYRLDGGARARGCGAALDGELVVLPS